MTINSSKLQQLHNLFSIAFLKLLSISRRSSTKFNGCPQKKYKTFLPLQSLCKCSESTLVPVFPPFSRKTAAQLSNVHGFWLKSVECELYFLSIIGENFSTQKRKLLNCVDGSQVNNRTDLNKVHTEWNSY